jgi:hypothetical protein
MKVKLLKKIKKRFSWYRSTAGNFVVTDHKMETCTFIDKKYFLERYPEVKYEVTEIHLFRLMKIILTQPFVENYLGKVDYRWANRRFKTRLPKKK